MAALQDYLKTLNSCETQWGIWVNPENPSEEYRVGQYCFENGGMNDGWIGIGTLESLSFGFHSDFDAFEEAADQAMKGHQYSKDALYEAFCSGLLADELQSQIRGNIDDIHEAWADEESSVFVSETLPEIIQSARSEDI